MRADKGAVGTVAVVCAFDLSDYAFVPLCGTREQSCMKAVPGFVPCVEVRGCESTAGVGRRCAFERAVTAAYALPGCHQVCVYADAASAAKVARFMQCATPIFPSLRVNVLDDMRVSAFFAHVARVCAEYAQLGEEPEAVFVLRADAPFIDSVASAQLYAQHREYLAEYSFADGYPEGLFAAVVAPGLFPILATLTQDAHICFDTSFIFESIKTDINSFDLETMIAPVDVRHLRLEFYTSSKAQFLQCAAFTDITAENYAQLISAREHALRTVPAYYALELTRAYPLSSLYRPVSFPAQVENASLMPKEEACALIRRIADFSERAVISLSVFGDPVLYPALCDVVREILKYPGLSVLIETSGLGWQESVVRDLCECARNSARTPFAIGWIVFLDAVSSGMYSQVHRVSLSEAEFFLKEATEFAMQVHAQCPGVLWPQIFRMNENEKELEPFYRTWKERVGQVIVQKYDHVCGLLPDRRVADLSPLERYPCWHLKRDMIIFTDGRVPLCKEDVHCRHALGNAFQQDLAQIWRRGQDVYLQQIGRAHV